MPTEADALGPFYVSGTPVVDDLNRYGKPGSPLMLTGRILSSEDKSPVSGARIEIWQTDGEGNYHPQANGAYADYEDAEVDLRGTVSSDDEGRYAVRTVVPGAYFPRPRHFHYRITAPGYQALVTQLYVAGDRGDGRPGCREARFQETDRGLLYAAPDIFLSAG